MGIYDRDYYRQEQRSGFSSYFPNSVVGFLIVVNVAVWLIDGFSKPMLETPDGQVLARWLSDHLMVHVSTLGYPGDWWQYLTAGFTHDPKGMGHLLSNMLVLFFLGRDVELRYGAKEFLRVYLIMLVFANFAWTVIGKLTHVPPEMGVCGASGAIAGVVVLYAFNYPHRTLLLFFVLPVPAWLLGVGVVAYDIYGATVGIAGTNVAYSVHVAGAAFALVYYQLGWNFTRLGESRFRWPSAWFRDKPHLQIHNPGPDPQTDLKQEVDRILEKIYRDGEARLTSKERATLEKASREYQQQGVGKKSDPHDRTR